MYVPDAFKVDDAEALFDFIEQRSFGLVVAGTAPFQAAHIPFLLDRQRGVLSGHVARADPIWRALDGGAALVIFSGPHAYISPDWYETDGLVPTWNYVAVHAEGRARLLDAAATDDLLNHLTAKEEAVLAPKQAWAPGRLPAKRHKQLTRALVAFEITIENLMGKWKLSQNRTPADRKSAAAALRACEAEEALEVATLMEATL